LQEDLGLLDIKLSEIEKILKNARIIKNPVKTAQASVDLGATVLVDINGKNNELTIVGTLEADPDQGKISNESPVGKILLGKRAGDRVAVDPAGKITYKIKKNFLQHLIIYLFSRINQKTALIIKITCGFFD
jgi:Transcription elongation factor